MVVETDHPRSKETTTTPTSKKTTIPLLKEKLASSLALFRNKRPSTPNRKVAIIEKYNSSTAGTGPTQSAPVQAYAKLAGANWTFYIQSLAITLGRTSDQDETSDKERKRHDSKLSADESEQVIINVVPPVEASKEDVADHAAPTLTPPEPSETASGSDDVLVTPASESSPLITTVTPPIIEEQPIPPTPSSEPSKEIPPPAFASDVIDVDLGPAKVVSRKHARVEFNFYTRKWDLHVLGRNGLKVNEMVFKPECSPIQLESGMLLEVGGVQFTFVLPDGYTASSTPDGSRTPIEEGLMPPPNNRSRSRNRRASLDEGLLDHANFDYRSDTARMNKPPYSYATLIAQAINSVPTKRLTLAGIYQYISENYAFYRHSPTGWQNSIRHNLSLNKAFQKVPRGINEPGKGMLWLINSECGTSFEDGTARRRRPSAGSGRSSPSTSRQGSDHEGEQRYQHSGQSVNRNRRSRAASDEEMEEEDTTLYRNRQRTSSYLIPSNSSSAHSSNPSSPSPRLTKRLRASTTSAGRPLRNHSYNDHYSTPPSPSSSALPYMHMLPSAFPISPSSSRRFRPLRSSLSKFPSSPPWSEASSASSSSSSTSTSPITSPSSLDPPLIPCTPASLMSSMPHVFLDLKIVDFLPPVGLTGKFPLPTPLPGSTSVSLSAASSVNSSSSSSPTAVGKQSVSSPASHTHHSHHHLHHPHLPHLVQLAPAGTPRRIQPQLLQPPSVSSSAGTPVASTQTKTPAASPPPPTLQRPSITCDSTKLAPKSSLPSSPHPSLPSQHTQLSLHPQQSSHNHNLHPNPYPTHHHHHHYQHIQPHPAPFAIHPYPSIHAHPPPHAIHHPHMALMYGPPLQRNMGNPMLAMNMGMSSGMNMGGMGMMASPGSIGNGAGGSGQQTGKMRLQAKLQAKVAAKAAAAMAAAGGPGNNANMIQSPSENEQNVGYASFGNTPSSCSSSTTLSLTSNLSSPAGSTIPTSSSSSSSPSLTDSMYTLTNPHIVPIFVQRRHKPLVPIQPRREPPMSTSIEMGNGIASVSDMMFANPILNTCGPLDVSELHTQKDWNSGESVSMTFDSCTVDQEMTSQGGLVGMDHHQSSEVTSVPDPTYLDAENEGTGKKDTEDTTRGSGMEFELEGHVGMELDEFNRDGISMNDKDSWTQDVRCSTEVFVKPMHEYLDLREAESENVDGNMNGVERRGRNGTESMDLDDLRETREGIGGMVGMDVGNGREVLR